MIGASIFQSERDAAVQQISAAWKAYQSVEKRGLEFGRVCYEWQQKLKGGIGRKGQGLSPMLETLNIPSSTAYFWIQRYKEANGLVDVKPPTNPEPPKGSIVPSTYDEWAASPLSESHFRRDKNPGGTCEFWAYKSGDGNLGFAVVKYVSEGTFNISRIVVSEDLPDDDNIRIGSELMQHICNRYPHWRSVTDGNREAKNYHAYYEGNGIRKSKPTIRGVPPALIGIPLAVDDWESPKKCEQFLVENPDWWHEKLPALAEFLPGNRSVRPGGRTLTLIQRQNKIRNELNTATTVLWNSCPCTQITYEFGERPIQPDPKQEKPAAVPTPEPTPKPQKNPELVAAILAHEALARELNIFVKSKGFDADISRSKTDGKFHVIWHDATPEQIRKRLS